MQGQGPQRQPAERRAVVKEYTAKRGDIVSADGVTLATSVPTNDQLKYLRKYPTGFSVRPDHRVLLFHLRLGRRRAHLRQGAHRKQEPLPTADQPERAPQPADEQQSEPVDHPHRSGQAPGRGQRSAGRPNWFGSGPGPPQRGHPGHVLQPDVRPERHCPATTCPPVEANYKALTQTPGGVLDPPAYRQTLFPGSTFKIVTSSAVYDHNPALATKIYPTLSALPLPQTTNELHNFGGEVCGGQLPQLFTVSCDTGFGQIGLDLGGGCAQPGSQRVRLQSGPTDRPALRRQVVLPAGGQLRPGPAWPGLLGHRAAGRAGHAAADGPGGGRYRRRRPDDDPPHARPCDQLAEPGGEHLPVQGRG